MGEEACPPTLVPLAAPCPNGQCANSTRFCACPPGWTGLGDFSAGQHCLLRVQAVQGLWSVACVGNAVAVAVTAWFTLAERSKALALPAGERHRQRLRIVYGVLVTSYHSAFVVVGALRASAPETRAVGSDPTTTTVFSLGAVLCWWTCLAYVQVYGKAVGNIMGVRDTGHMITRAYARFRPFYVRIAAVSVLVSVVWAG